MNEDNCLASWEDLYWSISVNHNFKWVLKLNNGVLTKIICGGTALILLFPCHILVWVKNYDHNYIGCIEFHRGIVIRVGGNYKWLALIESISDYDNASSIDLKNATLGFCAQLSEAPNTQPQTIDIVHSLFSLGVWNIALVFLFQIEINTVFILLLCSRHQVCCVR